MFRAKSQVLILVVVLTSALLFATCTPAAAPPTPKPEAKAETKVETKPEAKPASAKPKELVKFKVAHPHKGLPEIANAPIAGLKGFFEEEGLDVEFFWTKGGGDTVRAVTTGGVDIGMDNGPMGILGAIEQGANLKIISAGVTGPEFVWVVPSDSPVKTIKDLEDKKIGYSSQGSSTHLVSMAILEQSGVKAELVASGSIPDSWTAAKTHQIDAAWSNPPDTYKLEQEGARRVFASKDYPILRDYTYIVNFTTAETVKNKLTEITAFHRALNKAAEFVAKDPEGAAKIYLQNTNLPEDLLVRYFKSIKPQEMWNLATIKGWETTSKYAKLFKFTTKDVELKEVFDGSTLPK